MYGWLQRVVFALGTTAMSAKLVGRNAPSLCHTACSTKCLKPAVAQVPYWSKIASFPSAVSLRVRHGFGVAVAGGERVDTSLALRG